MVIFFGRLKRGVPQVAPEDRDHTQLVCRRKCAAYLLDFPSRFLGAEVNRGADSDSPHVKRLLDGREDDLVILVGIAQKLVVIDLHKKWDLMSVFAAD